MSFDDKRNQQRLEVVVNENFLGGGGCSQLKVDQCYLQKMKKSLCSAP